MENSDEIFSALQDGARTVTPFGTMCKTRGMPLVGGQNGVKLSKLCKLLEQAPPELAPSNDDDAEEEEMFSMEDVAMKKMVSRKKSKGKKNKGLRKCENKLAQVSEELAKAKAEIATLKRQLEGDFGSNRNLEEVLEELDEVTTTQAAVEAKIYAADNDMEKEIDATESLGTFRKGNARRAIRDKYAAQSKALVHQELALRTQGRELMIEAALSGPAVPVITLPVMLSRVEEFIVRSPEWLELFQKDMDPCRPAMLQKGMIKTFDGWVPKLLAAFMGRPEFIDEQTYGQLILDAMNNEGNPAAPAVFTRLGYPSLAEFKQSAYKRLVSVNTNIFNEASGWKSHGMGGMAGAACQ
jgi:hypothetical protein